MVVRLQRVIHATGANADRDLHKKFLAAQFAWNNHVIEFFMSATSAEFLTRQCEGFSNSRTIDFSTLYTLESAYHSTPFLERVVHEHNRRYSSPPNPRQPR